MRIDLWVHAAVLPVRLRLVPAGGAGHLETLVMRAVSAGTADVDNLSAMFGLSSRMTLDVVGDLWRAGRVGLDDAGGLDAIVLTSQGEEELADLDENGVLPSGYQVTDAHQVLLDTLTGRVLPITRGRFAPEDRSLLVPTGAGDASHTEVAPEAVVTAAMADLEDRRRGKRANEFDGMRVASATVSPKAVAGHGGFRYLRMEVEVRRSSQDGLNVEVVDETFPLTFRNLATRRLDERLSGDPRPPLAKKLSSLAPRTPFKPRDVTTEVGELRRIADRLIDAVPANRQRQHDLLARRARDLYEHARARAQQELDVQLVESEIEHRQAILSLIGSAERQIVMVVPWVREKALRPYLDALTEAVRNGVGVFLLWGIRESGEELDSDVRSQLVVVQREATAAGRRGDLHFADIPALVHAKVVVADDRRALVTSRNFFSGSTLKELGVVLAAPDDRRAILIENLLQWARRVAPSAQLAQRLAHHHSTFADDRTDVPVPSLVLPGMSQTLTTAQPGSPIVTAWSDGWRAVVEGVAEMFGREQPVVSMVVDGLHRTLLDRALETAGRRVVIASDGFSSSVVTSGIVTAARETAARDVDVTFVYGRGRDSDAEYRVTELTRPVNDTRVPIVRQVKDHHAKVLLWDDSVVVGSYNHLSMESARRRGRTTGELSVQIDSARLSDQIASRLERSHREGMASASRPAAGTNRVATPPVTVALAAQQVVELFAQDGPVSPARVADALTAGGAPDAVLDMVATQSDTAAHERALAAMVHAGSVDDRWQRRLLALIRMAWRRGAWWAAAQLRTALDPSQDGPSVRLCGVATAAPGEVATLLMSWADEDPPPPEERAALCLLVVVLLLRHAEPGLQKPLVAWRDGCRAEVLAPIGTALEGTARHGALPTVALADAARHARVEAQLNDHWDSLNHAVGELRRYKPHSPIGDRLLESLFGRDPAGPASPTAGSEADAEMARLESIVAERDAFALGTWAEQYLNTDDGRWLDRASTRAGLDRAVDDGRRISFISKHAGIRRAAEDVRRTASGIRRVAELTPDQEELISAIHEQLSAARPTVQDGWSGDLARTEIDCLLDEITGRSPAPAPGWAFEEWRFPRLAAPGPRSSAEAARLLAADLCSSWSPSESVQWLIEEGEFASAARTIGQLAELRLLSTAGEEALYKRCADGRDSAVAEQAREQALIRARADRAGVPGPDVPSSTVIERLALERDRQQVARTAIGKVIETAREDLTSDLERHAEALEPGRVDRIRQLIGVGELVAARRMLNGDDDGIGLVPLLPKAPSWPLRSLTLPNVVHQLRHAQHRYTAVERFVPAAGDEDGERLIAALGGLTKSDAPTLTAFVEAVQLLVEDPGVPRRLHPLSATPPAQTVETFTTTIVLPGHPTLPALQWSGKSIVVTVGHTPADNALFCLSPQVAAPHYAERVVDVSAILPLLAPHEGRVPSRQVRAMRLLRAVCAELPLEQIVRPEALEPLVSADARVRLWTLLHLLGFDLDDIARASIVAMAGDHPQVLWRLVEAALEQLRDPDVAAAELDTRWDTNRVLARHDFDDIVHRAVRSDEPDTTCRAVLAAVAFLSGQESMSPDTIAGYIASGVRLPEDQQALEALVTADVVAGHLAVLTRKRYVTQDGERGVRVRDDLVGRSLMRRNPGGWLEDEASALLRSVISDEDRFVRDFSHYLLQDYRGRGSDSQALQPADLTNPDVPCCASRWAAMMVSRSEVQDWLATDGVSVSSDIEKDLWVRGPVVTFALTVDNLLQNARTVLRESRPVDDIGRVYLRLISDADPGRVTLELGDNGPGLPDQVRDGLNRSEQLPRAQRGHGLSALQEWAARWGWTVRAGEHPHLGGTSIAVSFEAVPAPPV